MKKDAHSAMWSVWSAGSRRTGCGVGPAVELKGEVGGRSTNHHPVGATTNKHVLYIYDLMKKCGLLFIKFLKIIIWGLSHAMSHSHPCPFPV